MVSHLAIGLVLGALAPYSTVNPIIDAAKDLRAIVEQMELDAIPVPVNAAELPLSLRETRDVAVEAAAGPALRWDARLSPVNLDEER